MGLNIIELTEPNLLKQIKISSGMHQQMQRRRKRKLVRGNLKGFKKPQLCSENRVKTNMNFLPPLRVKVCSLMHGEIGSVTGFRSVSASKRKSN